MADGVGIPVYLEPDDNKNKKAADSAIKAIKDVAKAADDATTKARTKAKQYRVPAGDPSGRGGQFAPVPQIGTPAYQQYIRSQISGTELQPLSPSELSELTSKRAKAIAEKNTARTIDQQLKFEQAERNKADAEATKSAMEAQRAASEISEVYDQAKLENLAYDKEQLERQARSAKIVADQIAKNEAVRKSAEEERLMAYNQYVLGESQKKGVSPEDIMSQEEFNKALDETAKKEAEIAEAEQRAYNQRQLANVEQKKSGKYLKDYAKNTLEYYNKLEYEARRVYMTTRRLGEVGRISVMYFGGALASMALSANKYVSSVGMAEQVSSDWKTSMAIISEATTDIGREFATVLLPYLKFAASTAKWFAGLIEKHPWIAGGAVMLAGIGTGIGTTLVIASQLIRVISGSVQVYSYLMKSVLTKAAAAQAAAGAEMGAAAKTQMAAATMMAGSSVGNVAGGATKLIGAGGATASLSGLIKATPWLRAGIIGIVSYAALSTGALIGKSIGNWIGKMGDVVSGTDDWAKGDYSAGKTVKQTAYIMTAFALDQMSKGKEMSEYFKSILDKVGKILGVIETSPTTPYGSVEGITITEPMALAMRDYAMSVKKLSDDLNKDLLAAKKQFNSSIKKLDEDYYNRLAEREADFARSQSKAYRDFYQSEAEIEQNYYDDRIKTAQDNSKKLLEMEQDHQIGMRRDLEDHQDTLRDLLESRNSGAMIKEDRKYEKERQRKEEDYALEVSRIDQESADNYRRREQEFAKEKAQRAAQFAQRMADAQAEYARESASLAKEREIRKKELLDNYNEQVESLYDVYEETGQEIKEAFFEKLRSINAYILGDYNEFQNTLVLYSGLLRNMLITERMKVADWYAQGGYLQFVDPSLINNKGIGKDTGGYASYGKYTLGEKGVEWIMTANTTKAAERILGARLTQTNLLSALIANRSRSYGGGKQVGYKDDRTIIFNGMNEADRAAIRRDVAQITREVLVEAMS